MSTKKRFVIGTAALLLLGSAFHFLFELLGNSFFAAPFFAVNESVWEHMKLLNTAALLWMAADWFMAEKHLRPCCFAARALALPIALLAIPLIFYFIKGALGVENLVIDILVFLVSVLLYQLIVIRLEGRCPVYSRYNKPGIFILCFLFLLFALFTFMPPHLPIFQDPPTGAYGIIK